MGFLKRTNKKFDYQPRYYKGEGNPFKIEHKLDKFRTTTGKSKGLKSTFSEAVKDLNGGDKSGNKTIIYIVVILVLIFLFIIDFDLSIFYSK
ncbi:MULTISPECIES: riboflavin synthase subunit beta [unclassified Polaribacter]|uniref:riboflavin synthase subunit beta n=1 Tax=unclassified Polaribacter TaxID=196858 RepID=UPI0011BF00D7|nr:MULTISPECIES: riboflavin synthase subunit beta [unclassified Polaribacter]TXD52529.1 riboflavin synthase subunit beta [Polaribacter sp. IC063]TXD60515.1 riboflavin synthase subunit beta [Polaribacter sp. IC066]